MTADDSADLPQYEKVGDSEAGAVTAKEVPDAEFGRTEGLERHAEEDSEEGADDRQEPAREAGTDDLNTGRAATLGAKIKALEAAIAQAPDQQWEPDGSAADELAGTHFRTMRWRDHVEPEPDARPRPEPETVESTAYLDVEESEPEEERRTAGASEELLLDEDALRDMVAEIVRQELQGALGERITRNVRKLVRREIHRALTAQELD